jgi:hypothetical protein
MIDEAQIVDKTTLLDALTVPRGRMPNRDGSGDRAKWKTARWHDCHHGARDAAPAEIDDDLEGRLRPSHSSSSGDHLISSGGTFHSAVTIL